jgi:hypothetical protein
MTAHSFRNWLGEFIQFIGIVDSNWSNPDESATRRHAFKQGDRHEEFPEAADTSSGSVKIVVVAVEAHLDLRGFMSLNVAVSKQ